MASMCINSRSLAEVIASDPPERFYLQQLHRHRLMWESKPAVRAQYGYWYRMIADQMTDLSPSYELGCGCGNFKTFRPDVTATDSIATPWCEQVVDACQMPFDSNSVGNLVLFDVLHHIPDPLQVFCEASRVLRPQGRIIVVEPLLTAWSRIVYHFHHEPYDERSDFFSAPRCPALVSADYANEATATILFRKHRSAFLEHVSELRWVWCREFSCLTYPLTGGFQPFCLIPAFAVEPLCRVEDFLISTMRCRFLALRIMVVLEKKSPPEQAGPV